MQHKIICIDPGLGGTGFAIFSGNKQDLLPERTGVLHSTTKATQTNWSLRQSEILARLIEVIEEVPLIENNISVDVYIELPNFFRQKKGMTCATGKDGGDSDLVKLAVMVGRLQETFLVFTKCTKIVLVPVSWKGQLTKYAVENRIRQRIGCKKWEYGDHATDAVGIGLFVKGVFKANATR